MRESRNGGIGRNMANPLVLAAAFLLFAAFTHGAVDEAYGGPSIRTVASAEGEVLALSSSTVHKGESVRAGVTFTVSTREDIRTFRATVGGRSITTHVQASAPPTYVAFDLANRRFRKLAHTVRVELDGDEPIDGLVRQVGGVSGKAYPPLGFALITLPRSADPADAVNRLKANGEAATVLLAPTPRRPAVVRPQAALRLPTTKTSLYADLIVFVNGSRIAEDGTVTTTVSVLNWGAADSSSTTLFARVSSTPTLNDVVWSTSRPVPALVPKDSWNVDIPISLAEPPTGRPYYLLAYVEEQANEIPGRGYTNESVTGLMFDASGSPQLTCAEPGRGGLPGVADPLYAQQWHLRNTGQTGYANDGGGGGQDLRLGNILTNGPYGTGVRVAVVDTGLEICHPDLAASVEVGASFNFNALSEDTAAWSGAELDDPFHPYPAGDHGTSVAGLIAAEAANGIGGRGVAPRVRLRGYNYLEALDNGTAAFLDAHGVSRYAPDSSDVDIFNMSFGGLPYPANASPEEELLFAYGTRRLRDGLGAIYVKSAGNSFDGCASLRHPLNERIGCGSANGDGLNNLPNLIIVGGLNARGGRASYSSVGANLWVSAPAGEYGVFSPAMITTDQTGTLAGYGVVYGDRLTSRADVNPNGDYTSSFNGTSSAAPNLSGVVAILLDAVPELTWRDVKHVLAKTARQTNSTIRSVRSTFGETSRVVQHGWRINGAGYNFHNWYGFGGVHAASALAEARRMGGDALGPYRRSGWFRGAGNLALPGNDGGGATQSLVVAGLPTFANIEAVVLEVALDHPFPHDVGIELISPMGMRSIVNPPFNEALALDLTDVTFRWRLLSNAFYGENPNGTWRLSAFDGAATDTGAIAAWRLRFDYGDHPASARGPNLGAHAP